VLHQAAALLFELDVRADTPTHEAAKILKDSGYGAPYGRAPWDPKIRASDAFIDSTIRRWHNDSMTREATIKILAARAASILAQWAGLAGPAKFNNGDPSPVGGLAMMLATMGDKGTPPPSDAQGKLEGATMGDKGTPPPSDAQGKLEGAIIGIIAARDKETRDRGYRVDGLHFYVSSDYDPDHRLIEVAEAAGLSSVSWPWKSSLTIGMTYSDGSGSEYVRDVRDCRGYGWRGVTYRLLPNQEGWLITDGFEVPTPVLDICLEAAKAGHAALRYEARDSFTKPDAPAEPQPATFDCRGEGACGTGLGHDHPIGNCD